METLFKISTREGLVKFVEDNSVMFWSQLDVEIHYDIWETRLVSGIPHALFNGVLRSQYPTKNINQQVELTIEHFKKRNLPFTWWVSHRSTPKNLGDKLVENNLLHIGVLPAMVALSSEKHADEGHLEGLSVYEIDTTKDLTLWGNVLAQAFNIKSNDVTEFCSFFPKPGSSSELQHYIGIYKGVVVACATLFITGSTCGLYNIGVLPEYRCLGIGTQIVKSLLSKAYHHKCQLIAMQSYPIVVDACKKLGFVRISDNNVYVWMQS